MITLAVDASTYVGTTAVLDDGRVIADGSAAMRGRDAEALMPAIAATLERASVSPARLSRIVCGAGPGSFTSLRIAASIAKGLALAAGCPMFAVSSLALVVTAEIPPAPGHYLAVLDALRGDAYVAGYVVSESGDVSVSLAERLVKHSEVTALANALTATTIGPGQQVDRAPHARGVSALEPLLAASRPVDIGRWEPVYGRKAEAQVRWETAHGRELGVDAASNGP